MLTENLKNEFKNVGFTDEDISVLELLHRIPYDTLEKLLEINDDRFTVDDIEVRNLLKDVIEQDPEYQKEIKQIIDEYSKEADKITSELEKFYKGEIAKIKDTMDKITAYKKAQEEAEILKKINEA